MVLYTRGIFVPANSMTILYGSWSWPAHYRRTEWIGIEINITLYIPIGVFGFLSLFRSRAKLIRVCTSVVIGFVLSCCIEMLELLDAGAAL